MYRARLELQPKIPMCALEFTTIIKECAKFNQFFKKTVVVREQCSVIFFSENTKENLMNAANLHFDGTFKKCLKLLNLEGIFCLEITACWQVKAKRSLQLLWQI